MEQGSHSSNKTSDNVGTSSSKSKPLEHPQPEKGKQADFVIRKIWDSNDFLNVYSFTNEYYEYEYLIIIFMRILWPYRYFYSS